MRFELLLVLELSCYDYLRPIFLPYFCIMILVKEEAKVLGKEVLNSFK